MDKVIIDGIDVSECTFWKAEDSWGRINACSQRFTRQCECANNSDCYYKQLQRAKAEYDDLHLSYAGCKTANTGLQEVNQKLQAENEKLKNQYSFSTILKIDKLEQENERLKEEVEHYRKEAYRLADGLNKTENLAFTYKQALQEIRDVVSEHIVCDDCKLKGTDKCDARMCTHFYLNDFSKDIIDKINSVIGAE